jgi:hypothetical protein
MKPFIALGLIFAAQIFAASTSAQSSCPCSFKDPPWEAYGTKAACTAIVRKGGTSCEIEFGGISADPKVAAQVLGVNPADYTRQMYDVLQQFLQYLRDNKRDALADPKFLATALPSFMRGAYFRHPLNDENISQARSLDAAIVTFLAKDAGQVSKVFLGGAPPFKDTFNGATFSVERGSLTVDHPFGVLITRYMPAE